MVTQLTDLNCMDVFAACESGRYLEARELLPVLVDEPEVLLAYGMVETAKGSQSKAKDYLSKAVRLADSKDVRDKARIQLALAYWRCGEIAEAKAILKGVAACFDLFLTKAMMEPSPKRALNLLNKAASYRVSPGREGRLHNYRAMKLKALGENDRAIQEYEAALFCFEQVESDECLVFVCNNLGGLYAEYGEYEKAHAHVDRAISLLGQDSAHLSKALDQKAQVLLKENRFAEATTFILRALRLSSDYKAWRGECLITYAHCLAGSRKFAQALLALEEAEQLGLDLNNDELRIDAALATFRIAGQLVPFAEKQLIEIALKASGSIRAAAARIGTSHQIVLGRIERYCFTQQSD